jgi:hypothetical protein
MRSASELQKHGERAQDSLDNALNQIEERMQRMVRDLRMTQPMRVVAQRAFARASRARRFLILPRHTATQRRFLRGMIYLALATDSSLQKKAGKVAKFYSRYYVYEWLINPVTAPARQLARDAILRSGDSEYGETPLAGPLAYVMFHHDEVDVQHLSAYSELYTRTLALDRLGFFRDRGAWARQRVGVPSYAERPAPAKPAPEETEEQS